jgi:cytochrome b pre-mRNA-processing protein 3
LSLLQRLFGETRRSALEPLYRAVVAAGRDPGWYREGGVPDTLDGRFDMIAAVTTLALLRFEAEGEAGRGPSVILTELFIEDMDGILRQIGVGDYVVGKHLGRMMGALGGRLGAFRSAKTNGTFTDAVRRNIFRDSPTSEQALDLVSKRLQSFDRGLETLPLADILAGRLPSL